jgi:hypothetical protein
MVSDHGMATPNANQLTLLHEVINLSNVRTVPVGPMMALHTGNRRRSLQLRDELNESLDNTRAYLREDIPAHLHHRSNRRIGDILVIPEGTGMVRSTSNATVPAGMHGWDPTSKNMHGVFMASGPGLRPGTVLPEVHSIDVYPFLATLLDLEAHQAVSGDVAVFESALTSPNLP